MALRSCYKPVPVYHKIQYREPTKGKTWSRIEIKDKVRKNGIYLIEITKGKTREKVEEVIFKEKVGKDSS